ncbi:hypothetical protein B6D52_01995 [Candidatus Parcubacteria bacterium 4484_255]|nr:MAG: hypothetical protein B6D52_01995 [Candidatus Parcubacteria bacterium 4484_255]
MQFIKDLDYFLCLWINNWAGRSAQLDVFGIFCADFLIFAIPLFIIFFYFFNRRNRLVLIFLKIILAAALSYLVNCLLNYILGIFFIRPRPFVVFPEIYQLSKFLLSSESYSFPSDHTTIAFVMALVVFLDWRKFGIILLALSLFVGLSRIFTGVHYPLDIFGGILTAFFSVWMVDTVFRKNKKFRSIQNF